MENLVDFSSLGSVEQLNLLIHMLESPEAEARQRASIAIATMPSDHSEQILVEAMERESDAATKRCLQISRVALHAAREASDYGPLIAAEAPALSETLLGDAALEVLKTARAKVLVELQILAAEEVARGAPPETNPYSARKELAEFSQYAESELCDTLLLLNGRADRHLLTDWECKTILAAPQLWSVPEFSLLHAARILAGSHRPLGDGCRVRGIALISGWNSERFRRFFRSLPTQQQDLRSWRDAYLRCGVGHDQVVRCPMLGDLPPDGVWPLLNEDTSFMDDAFRPRLGQHVEVQWIDPFPTAVEMAATFPRLRAPWISQLFQHALGKLRNPRKLARRLLDKQPGIGKWVCELISADDASLRSKAVDWLIELGYRDAVAPIREAMQKELDHGVRARLLAALEALGEDVSDHLSVSTLMQEAEMGLSEKAPAAMNWLPFDTLPACAWASGGTVDSLLIRWWVTLAWRLNDARGNALLDRYLGLLSPASQTALGSYILKLFIDQDTKPPSERVALAYAEKRMGEVRANLQSWNQPALTAEEESARFEQFRREKLRECVGSAISAKGILALALHAPGHELASRARAYMRNYHTRLAQIEALLELLAHSEARPALQLLLNVSHRYRKAQIQDRAGELVRAIALRNDWSEQELADRSVPTAGLDESGELLLEYGERTFTVTLDEAMRLILKSGEGKILKALPEPRVSEDAELVKAAKQQFAACKKELKQVVEQQRTILREAMCSGRTWSLSVWNEVILQHPILGRLAQQLIWQAADANGTTIAHFRPSVDKSLIDTNDDVVDLADGACIRLAHSTCVSPGEANAWKTHLADYKIGLLFPQFDRPVPELDSERPASEISDRQGWMADAYTLGGAFDRLGYVRGDAGEGGYVREYIKTYRSLNMTVVLGFTGVFVQGGNNPAALTTLTFMQSDGYASTDEPLPFDQVPQVLLSEAYADYLAVAGVCRGFDKDWHVHMM